MPISGSYFYPVMQKPTTSLDGGSATVDGNVVVRGLVVNDSGELILSSSDSVTVISGTLNVPGLPTSNPHVTGSLWNDAGAVKVSGYP